MNTELRKIGHGISQDVNSGKTLTIEEYLLLAENPEVIKGFNEERQPKFRKLWVEAGHEPFWEEEQR